MATTTTSLLVARRFERWSIYMRVLAEAGDLLRPGTDQRILADVRVAECLDDSVVPMTENMTLAALVRAARRTTRNHFPVLDEDGALVGMLELSSVRELLLDPELARVTLVGTVMQEGARRSPLTPPWPKPWRNSTRPAHGCFRWWTETVSWAWSPRATSSASTETSCACRPRRAEELRLT